MPKACFRNINIAESHESKYDQQIIKSESEYQTHGDYFNFISTKMS